MARRTKKADMAQGACVATDEAHATDKPHARNAAHAAHATHADSGADRTADGTTDGDAAGDMPGGVVDSVAGAVARVADGLASGDVTVHDADAGARREYQTSQPVVRMDSPKCTECRSFRVIVRSSVISHGAPIMVQGVAHTGKKTSYYLCRECGRRFKIERPA